MSTPEKLASAMMGKYEFLGAGAVGGMGEVYAVRHRLLQELRAVKVMRGAAALDRQLQERFILEARMSARLRHPNLVQLYDLAFREDGKVYMVLEWIEGLDLAQVLQQYGSPPLADALEIARQALSALDYLHGEEIVHRDIAPDNLMIAEKAGDGLQVKLIDLGIAKSISSDSGLTRKGLFVGKLHYAAPETLDTKSRPATPDPRSDLYSFGVVLYEMLTGRSPIVGSSESEILAGHLLGSPREFAETDPEGCVPDDLRAIVLRCLQKAPADRFQTAAELSQALAGVDVVEASPAKATALRRTITVATEHLRDLERSADLAVEQEEFNRTMESGSSAAGLAGGRVPTTVAANLGNEVSTEREIWFDELRRNYVRRKRTTRLSTVVRLIQTHPKPVVAGTSVLLLLVFVGFASFLRGGETPESGASAADSGERVTSVADPLSVPPDPQTELPGTSEQTGPAASPGHTVRTAAPGETAAVAAVPPAIALISDNAQLTTAVLDQMRGSVDLVIRQSLGEAVATANERGGPKRAIQLNLDMQPGTVEAYETLISTCRVVASGQILALPRGSSLFARSVEERAPQCGEAIARASRQLAEDLSAQASLLQGGR